MSEKKDNSDNSPFSDSIELFDELFSKEKDDEKYNSEDECSPDPGLGDVVRSEGEEREEETKSGTYGESPSQREVRNIMESDVKDIASKFWAYLKKDSKETFLDADIKDVSKAVINFLGKDVIGQKVVLLEDERLRTANVIARALKRKRSIIKSDKQKSIKLRILNIHRYLNNTFWCESSILKKSRKYMDNNLRRITPSILKGLIEVEGWLLTYFNGNVFDNSVFADDLEMEKLSRNLRCTQFAICQKNKQALFRNRQGDIFCSFTDCCKLKCPFDACKSHGEETIFISRLEEALKKKVSIPYQ